MATLADFLTDLLDHGTVEFRASPTDATETRAAALAVLERAFATVQLDLAGPPLRFESEIALTAAEIVRQACWFLVERSAPDEVVVAHLTLPPPTSAAAHLSADVCLRFLPQLHRRSKALAATDTLTTRLALLLRQWPLAGVLSDVPETPLTAPEFDGHPGLQLLYAERLARNEKVGWLPSGAARERVELVFHELGQERSPLLRAATEERNSHDGQ
jgi:hypothetical protein